MLKSGKPEPCLKTVHWISKHLDTHSPIVFVLMFKLNSESTFSWNISGHVDIISYVTYPSRGLFARRTNNIYPATLRSAL